MDSIDGLKTVIAVAETKSFTTAAQRLGMSKALVSKYVGQVEQRLQAQLFNRSTRHIALTEAGKRYYEKALVCLDHFYELEESISIQDRQPQGLLRISLQSTFGESHIAPLLPMFLQQYPDVQIELCLSDRRIDMLKEGIDLVIRMGETQDSQLIAKKITNYPILTCATPEYLAQNPVLQHPNDLLQHSCIIDSNFRIGKQWQFIDKEQILTIPVKSRVAVNSPRAVRELVLSGLGIGLITSFVVEDVLQSGELVEVLPEYRMLSFNVYVLYPHRRYLPHKVKCFIEFLQQHFSHSPDSTVLT